MARQIRVNVDPEQANYLERLNYELGFTKDIIQRMIEGHMGDADFINSEAFKAYQKQGSELNAEYNLAANEIEKAYVPAPLIEGGHQYKWIIPNGSNEMIIDVLCDCEIEGL